MGGVTQVNDIALMCGCTSHIAQWDLDTLFRVLFEEHTATCFPLFICHSEMCDLLLVGLVTMCHVT